MPGRAKRLPEKPPLNGVRSLRVRNFKSYRDATIRLSPLTLLVGPNASGKSNLVEGIRLLSWLARGKNLDEVLRGVQEGDAAVRGGIDDLANSGEKGFSLGCSANPEGDDGITEFDVGIRVSKEGLRIAEEKVWGLFKTVPLYRVEKAAKGFFHDVQVTYDNFASGGRKPSISCTDQQLILTQLTTPARFAEAHAKSQKTIPRVCKRLAEALAGIFFLDPVPRQMRSYPPVLEDTLREDGSNLSSVLFSLCDRGHRGVLLDFIRAIPEQDITSIDFHVTPRDDVMVRLEESFGGRKGFRDAPVLSDGTLRVLAIAAALLSARAGSLVVIEEVDNGVHPSRAKTLLENVFKVSKDRALNVLLTTHNPALLDALPLEAVPKVACCYRDPDEGDSRIIHIEDIDSSPKLLAQGPLGRLMTNGILDRFLKDRRGPEEKKKAALAWLDRLGDS